ncbi:hypothetical protein [Salinimicrobium sp. TH3]|uniref:hypothetical protein n=1 Tax=Salinimicrobium sp. TH3 TaxID=2997342 RepID=UPI002273634C|nr:hypothetical protein [Salinimicrobium sp. TH3]MCY2687789.1 hypothetical protein [Salinimicrobium sp. TH3]
MTPFRGGVKQKAYYSNPLVLDTNLFLLPQLQIHYGTAFLAPFSPDSYREGQNKKAPQTGNRQQATGNRQQATGNRQLATGNWQQATGNRQLATTEQPLSGL